MSDPTPAWVHVLQPTVPHYRVPFFDLLAEQFGGRLRVSASLTASGNPDSAKTSRSYLDLAHTCRSLAGGRLYWQSAMAPLENARPGDVAVICGNPRFLSSLEFARRARRRGMGMVWWGHGHSPTSTAWSEALRALWMRSFDAVLLYTDEEAGLWRARLPPRVGVFGARNALDQRCTQAAMEQWNAERLASFRRQNGLDGRRLLLFCGRLRERPETRLADLLEALPALVATDASYLLVVIGDGPERDRLQRRGIELGVGAHVRWIGAQYDEAQNAPWFLLADAFVYPGSIGLSILHAMGFGLPVITHSDRRLHNPEIAALRHGWNGLEFVRGNGAALAEQILRLRADPALRLQLSNNARGTVEREFSLAIMTQRFAAAVQYARECARKRPPLVRTWTSPTS